MKPWPEEAPIEGWFPLYAKEQKGFDFVEDAIASSSYNEERQSFELANGSNANSERVVDRVENGDPRDCQWNPDKPRRTCRLRADAYVKENRRCMGEICLDTTFHRRVLTPRVVAERKWVLVERQSLHRAPTRQTANRAQILLSTLCAKFVRHESPRQPP